ncbi:MAG: TonB family protein [Thermodesulfovibrionales bacterium]
MREPRLYLSFSCSFFLHVILMVVVFLIISKTSDIRVQKTYIVSLISLPTISTGESESPPTTTDTTKKVEPPPQTKAKIDKQDTKRADKPSVDRNKMVEDRISELRAKKRIEGLASLRKNIDISDSERNQNTKTQGSSLSKIGAQGRDDYLSMIRTMIMQKWVYPDRIDKDLETIIAIRIQKDGRVSIIGIEKSSGNRLFDRSALSAISSISSVPRPPEGIEEVGIRFKP